MRKTALRIHPHHVLANADVVEIIHNGVHVGSITPIEGAGIRIVTKFPVEILDYGDFTKDIIIKTPVALGDTTHD